MPCSQVTAVFDAEVLTAYARMQPQALGLGELVAEIAADPQALAGVPRACLVAAFAVLEDPAEHVRLRSLMERPQQGMVAAR